MNQSNNRVIVLILVVLLGVGCSKKTPASRDSDHYVKATDGYLRLRDVEPKDIRFVITNLADLEQWQSTSNDEMGSYSPSTEDDFVRGIYLYKDKEKNDIRIDWVYEKGHDAIVLISADTSVRESVSSGIGINVLRRQQGLPWLDK